MRREDGVLVLNREETFEGVYLELGTNNDILVKERTYSYEYECYLSELLGNLEDITEITAKQLRKSVEELIEKNFPRRLDDMGSPEIAVTTDVREAILN